MIEFDSLQAGLYYYTHCPLCGNHMQIECIDRSFGFGNKWGYTVIFHLDGDDTLVINPVSEEIVINYQKSSHEDEINNKSYIFNPRSSTYNTYNGVSFYGLNIGCAKGGCGNFSYILRLTVDMSQLKLRAVDLSVMKVYVKDGNDTSEIATYFSSKTTVYGHSSSEGKFIELPMIDINLENPQETLSRVKKLIFFV